MINLVLLIKFRNKNLNFHIQNILASLLSCFNMRLILYLGNVSSVVNEIYFIAYSFNINFIFYSIFCKKLQTVGNKCFAKCVTKPGTSLSGGESSCVSRCVDRYIEATGIISRALFSSPRWKKLEVLFVVQWEAVKTFLYFWISILTSVVTPFADWGD